MPEEDKTRKPRSAPSPQPSPPEGEREKTFGRRIRLKRDNQVTHAKDSVMRLAKEGDVVDAIVQDANHLISLGIAEAVE
jgi:hypothetical protein